MRVISHKKIKEAGEQHPEWESSLAVWYRVAKKAKWQHIPDIKQTWSGVDKVGTCVVFDIGGNKCRLITYINFRFQRVYILHVLSHADYDKEGWKNDCGCD